VIAALHWAETTTKYTRSILWAIAHTRKGGPSGGLS